MKLIRPFEVNESMKSHFIPAKSSGSVSCIAACRVQLDCKFRLELQNELYFPNRLALSYVLVREHGAFCDTTFLVTRTSNTDLLLRLLLIESN